MTQFILAGGRARCSLLIQQKHKSVGGMGLPILKDYYTALVLDQLKDWFTNTGTKPWCQLEHAWLSPKSPISLLVAYKLPQAEITIEHPTMLATLQAWSYLKRTEVNTSAYTNILIPLESLKWIIPNISLNSLPDREIYHLTDIVQKSKLMPFTDIQEKYRIPSSEYLTFAQISSFYQHLKMTTSPSLQRFGHFYIPQIQRGKAFL